MRSGIDYFSSSLCLKVDRENDSDEYQYENDSDKVDQNIKDRAVASDNEKLMIFIDDRIDDRKPKRENYIHLIVRSHKLDRALGI